MSRHFVKLERALEDGSLELQLTTIPKITRSCFFLFYFLSVLLRLAHYCYVHLLILLQSYDVLSRFLGLPRCLVYTFSYFEDSLEMDSGRVSQGDGKLDKAKGLFLATRQPPDPRAISLLLLHLNSDAFRRLLGVPPCVISFSSFSSLVISFTFHHWTKNVSLLFHTFTHFFLLSYVFG